VKLSVRARRLLQRAAAVTTIEDLRRDDRAAALELQRLGLVTVTKGADPDDPWMVFITLAGERQRVRHKTDWS
jgi:hypothetical protein